MEEKNLKIDSFVKRCMQNTIGGSAKSNNQWYLECLNKAKNTEDFENLYFSTKDIDIMNSQAYGELLKKQSLIYEGYSEIYNYVMNQAEIKNIAGSDRAGLKIGNDNFSICVSNGYGDGVTKFAVFKKGNPYICAIDHMMDWQITIDGKFNIYSYDIGNDVVLELEGSYIVYSYNGFVALVEQDR